MSSHVNAFKNVCECGGKPKKDKPINDEASCRRCTMDCFPLRISASIFLTIRQRLCITQNVFNCWHQWNRLLRNARTLPLRMTGSLCPGGRGCWVATPALCPWSLWHSPARNAGPRGMNVLFVRCVDSRGTQMGLTPGILGRPPTAAHILLYMVWLHHDWRKKTQHWSENQRLRLIKIKGCPATQAPSQVWKDSISLTMYF